MFPTQGPFDHPIPVTMLTLSLLESFARAALALVYAAAQSPSPPEGAFDGEMPVEDVDDALVLDDGDAEVVREDVGSTVDLVDVPGAEEVAAPPGWHCE